MKFFFPRICTHWNKLACGPLLPDQTHIWPKIDSQVKVRKEIKERAMRWRPWVQAPESEQWGNEVRALPHSSQSPFHHIITSDTFSAGTPWKHWLQYFQWFESQKSDFWEEIQKVHFIRGLFVQLIILDIPEKEN